MLGIDVGDPAGGGNRDPQGNGVWIDSPIPGMPDRYIEDPGSMTEAERRSMELTARLHQGHPRLN